MRKTKQEENWTTFLKEKEDIKDDIKEIEGDDIQQNMLQERREWIQE